MDIEKELSSLLDKYGIDTSEYRPTDCKRHLYSVLATILERIDKDKKVGIRCAGIHTSNLIKDFKGCFPIHCIIDRNEQIAGVEFEDTNIPIIHTSQVEKEKLDIIIISSYHNRKLIESELMSYATIEIMDIYDLLIEEGVNVDCEYYNINVNPYIPIINLYNKFNSEHDLKVKAILLKKIITRFLDIRDISSTQKCLEQYICQKYDGYRIMELFDKELRTLIDRIKQKLGQRTHRDIIWFWQDALCYDWVDYMPFMKEMRTKGFCFDEAYSSAVWTRSMYALIFDKYYEIDDFVEWRKGKTQHKLTRVLEKKGYICLRVGSRYRDTINLSDFDYCNEKLESWETATSEYYWEILKLLSQEEYKNKPLLLLAHSVYESHQPLISPDLLQFDYQTSKLESRTTEAGVIKLKETVQITLKYLDVQTQFICSLFGKEVFKIFMSDHGTNIHINNKKWEKQVTHVNLVVSGPGVETFRYKKLFSYYYFIEMIELMLKGLLHTLHVIVPNEIKFQSVDVYNKDSIRYHISIHNEKYCLAFRGIQTQQDRYVKLCTGETIYNIFPDEFNNYTHCKEYNERIKLLDMKSGNFFIDINKELFFQYSKELYESLSKKESEKRILDGDKKK